MEWYRTLSAWLTSAEMGFVGGFNDPCVFVQPSTGLKVALDSLALGSRLGSLGSVGLSIR